MQLMWMCRRLSRCVSSCPTNHSASSCPHKSLNLKLPDKQLTLKLPHKPLSLKLPHKPLSLKLPHKPLSLKLPHKLLSLKLPHKPLTLKLPDKLLTIKLPDKPLSSGCPTNHAPPPPPPAKQTTQPQVAEQGSCLQAHQEPKQQQTSSCQAEQFPQRSLQAVSLKLPNTGNRAVLFRSSCPVERFPKAVQQNRYAWNLALTGQRKMNNDVQRPKKMKYKNELF